MNPTDTFIVYSPHAIRAGDVIEIGRLPIVVAVVAVDGDTITFRSLTLRERFTGKLRSLVWRLRAKFRRRGAP